MTLTLLRRRLPRAWPMLLFSACLATQTLAQPAPNQRRPDPLDPKAAVPLLRYESAFAHYRRLGDEQAVSWREANDAVARIGGWRAYARAAQLADPPPVPEPTAKPPGNLPADTASTPMPTSAGHSAHSGHKQP